MKNKKSIIREIVKNSRRFFLFVIFVLFSLLPGCGDYIPKDAAERWGWEYKEREMNYRESIRYRTVVSEGIDPKNNWLVLNHMMFHLLKKKAEGQSGSQAQKFLDQLHPLHFMDDSSEVAKIYEKGFMGENMNLERETPNDFIYKHLAQNVLPQVMSLGGFEQVMGLNEWGKTIIEKGPFKDIKRGFNSIEATSTSSGFTYKAVEDISMELKLKYVGIGPSDKHHTPADPFVSEGNMGFSDVNEKSIAGAESDISQMEEERKLYVPVNYDAFELRQVGLVKLPCPNINTLWVNTKDTVLKKLFHNSKWDGNRIVIDVSADVSEFINPKGIVEFDLNYVVTGLKGSEIKLAEETVHVSDLVGKEGGLIKRVITKPFPNYDSCKISVTLTNGQKALRKDSLITIPHGTYPLEIFSNEENILPSSGIPYFHIGAVKRGGKYRLFFALEKLSKNSNDYSYSGLANILILPVKDRENMNVNISDFTILGKDYKPGEDFYLTQDQVISSYNGKCFKTLELRSKYSNGYFLGEVEIPKETSIGNNVLAIEFYKFVDPKSKTVEKIGEAYKIIQIK